MRGLQADDEFYLKLQRKHGPVFKLFWGSRDLKISVVGFDRGRRLLLKNREVLNPVNTDIRPVVPHGYLRIMRGEIHGYYRRMFRSALDNDLIDSWSDRFRGLIRSELSRLAGRDNEDNLAQGLSETLNRIVTKSLLALIFGLEPENPGADRLYRMYCELGPKGYIEDVGHNQAKVYKAIRRHVLDGDTATRSDCVIQRVFADDSSRESDETAVGNAIYMVERGRHDLRDLLRWVIKHLCDNHVTVIELRERMEDSQDVTRLAQACIMETLRMEQAETVNRQATESFNFEGYHVPRNSWVSVLLRETHRSAIFDAPHAYRPKRFLEHEYSANEYSPFGLDAHQCIAGSFVVTFGGIFVEELVKGFCWDIVGDGPRHWGHFHWQPAPSFAIRLIPR
jgi:cytochrome P450